MLSSIRITTVSDITATQLGNPNCMESYEHTEIYESKMQVY